MTEETTVTAESLGLHASDIADTCEHDGCNIPVSKVDADNCLNDSEIDCFLCSKHFAQVIADRLASCNVDETTVVVTAETNDNPVTESAVSDTKETTMSALSLADIQAKIAELTAQGNAQAQALASASKPVAATSKPTAKKEAYVAKPLEPIPADLVKLAALIAPKIPALHKGLLDAKRTKQNDRDYIIKQREKSQSWKPYNGNGLHSKFDGFVSMVCALGVAGIRHQVTTSAKLSKAQKDAIIADCNLTFEQGIFLVRALVDLKVISQSPAKMGYTIYLFGQEPDKQERNVESGINKLASWGIVF